MPRRSIILSCPSAPPEKSHPERTHRKSCGQHGSRDPIRSDPPRPSAGCDAADLHGAAVGEHGDPRWTAGLEVRLGPNFLDTSPTFTLRSSVASFTHANALEKLKQDESPEAVLRRVHRERPACLLALCLQPAF